MAHTTIGMTLDCNDIVATAGFWRAALGYVDRGDPEPDATFHGLMSPPEHGGLHHLTLQRVGEPKATKNRAHLDLFVDDADAETARMQSLGATVVTEHPGDGDGFRTLVMADPEGNEFCVVERNAG